MANTFKNSITGSIGATGVVVYTCPAATSTTVIGMSVANVTSNNITVSTTLTSASQGKTVYLIKDATITSGGTSVLVGGEQKVVMSALDTLTVTSSAASSADVVVSVLEIS
jgi:hypothetical protein